MALNVPESFEEAIELEKKLVAFNNWQALVDFYKVQSESWKAE